MQSDTNIHPNHSEGSCKIYSPIADGNGWLQLVPEVSTRTDEFVFASWKTATHGKYRTVL